MSSFKTVKPSYSNLSHKESPIFIFFISAVLPTLHNPYQLISVEGVAEYGTVYF